MVLGHQKGRDTKRARSAQLRHEQARGLPQGAAPDEAGREVQACRCSPLSTRPAPIPASTPKSAASRGHRPQHLRDGAAGSAIITTIIGEGGSGGALAISVGDQVLMLQYSVYSVISPEGCASIPGKPPRRPQEAAEALGITAHRLKALGLVDKIVNEPVGGAHRDHKQMAASSSAPWNDAFRRQVSDLKVKEPAGPAATLRLQSYGRFTDTRRRAVRRA